MLGLTTVFYLNFVYSLTISVSSRATGLNKSCLNENVAMSECNSSYRFKWCGGVTGLHSFTYGVLKLPSLICTSTGVLKISSNKHVFDGPHVFSCTTRLVVAGR